MQPNVNDWLFAMCVPGAKESSQLLLIQDYTWQGGHRSSMQQKNGQYQRLSKFLQANIFPKLVHFHSKFICAYKTLYCQNNEIGSFFSHSFFIVLPGSPWVILSRSFLEYCVFGWDNLPRMMLMYVTNAVLSEEVYFHSVICNSPEFKNTTVNGDLRYMVWDNPPKMEPQILNSSDYEEMVGSGAAFARKFQKDDPVLDMIDKHILERGHNRATPGAWCSARKNWLVDPCSQWGDVNVLKPGPQVKVINESLSKFLDEWTSQSNQCR